MMTGRRTVKRPGRPCLPANEQRTHVISFRANAQELASGSANAAKAGYTSLNSYARAMFVNGEVVAAENVDAAPSELKAAYVAALNRHGVNLNQIAKKLNTKRYVRYAEIEDLIALIKSELDAHTGR